MILLWLLLSVMPLWAQVNIEHYRGKEGVTGGARLSLHSNIGNVDVVKSDGAGNVTVNTQTGTYLTIFKGGIGFLGGKRFANSGVLHMRYTHTSNARWQPEIFAQGDYAKSRRLDQRTLLGAGLRRIWNSEEEVIFSLGSSLMWEREALSLRVGDPHPSRASVGRSSTYVNMHIRRRLGFAVTAYYQFDLADPSDVRLLGTGELTTPLWGPLKQTTTVDFRTDSSPPLGVKETDAKLSTSFGVAF